MKGPSLDYCLNYIKFTLRSEGDESLSEEEERLFSDILEEDADSSKVIDAYFEEHGLKRDFDSKLKPGYYEGTKCPLNYLGIKDRDRLDEVDLMVSSIRTAGLFVDPINREPDLEYYLTVHKRLFSDIYPDAGKIREIDASKRTDFVPVKDVPRLLRNLFKKLKESDYLRAFEDEDDFINELSFIMGELESIHPFFDGNGRTTRFFVTHLAHRSKYEVDWINADSDSLLEASISAIDGDNQPLVDLLEEITYPIEED